MQNIPTRNAGLRDDVNVSVLLFDNDPGVLKALSGALARPGLDIVTATPESAVGIACRHRPGIVVAMPQPDGLDLLEQIVAANPSTRVVKVSSDCSLDCHGPDAQIGMPDVVDRVQLIAGEIRRHRKLHLDDESQSHPDFEGIVGRSPLMWELFTRIRRVAPYYRSVLISGETGTGKDLAARALHRLSPASKGHYVVLNCSAVIETLFESELFGHVKGSFTGAATDKAGLFEHAHGGTLFLDEIGDMPLATQAKLLRVLQSQEVQRVGSLNTRKVDVRVIAATNHDLRALIAQKRFREDLYYRLSMVELHMPRLADRTEDLPLLQRHFLSRFSAEYEKNIHGLSRETCVRLSRHSWPGNVRELENVIGHAAMMTSAEMIEARDLPEYLQVAPGQETSVHSPIAMTLQEQERHLLIRALQSSGGNRSKAARLLKIGRDALRYKLRKHNLETEESESVLAAAV